MVALLRRSRRFTHISNNIPSLTISWHIWNLQGTYHMSYHCSFFARLNNVAVSFFFISYGKRNQTFILRTPKMDTSSYFLLIRRLVVLLTSLGFGHPRHYDLRKQDLGMGDWAWAIYTYSISHSLCRILLWWYWWLTVVWGAMTWAHNINQ